MDGSKEKDDWDKLEIFAKSVGALLIPVIVAASVYLWNFQRTEEVKNSNFVDLAVKILSQPPASENPDDLALRSWAAKVLASPENPPSFGAAEQQAIASLSFALGSALTTDVLVRPPKPSQETIAAIKEHDIELAKWLIYIVLLCDRFGCSETWETIHN